MINADGQSIVWASRALQRPVPERVTGIDLMDALWDSAVRNGYRVFLLGATDDVVERVADLARNRGVNIVGARNGYWTKEQEAAVVEEVWSAQPHLLFLGIPSPQKEHFLARNLSALGANLAVGVGGSFDVIAGRRRRAPRWMRQAGLEWLFRLVQEPRRLFLRYLLGNLRFCALVWQCRRAQSRTARSA
jgi:N-acetylglucosaminyldiphosphoundecaprenol N-acetyl-beta-D-mannosaminyltransferase